MKEYVGPTEIMRDWDVSKATAYNLIRKLNHDLKEQYPTAIIVSGKVSRAWYNRACMHTQETTTRRNEDEQSD